MFKTIAPLLYLSFFSFSPYKYVSNESLQKQEPYANTLQRYADEINNDPESLWKAQYNENINDIKSSEDLNYFMGAETKTPETIEEDSQMSLEIQSRWNESAIKIFIGQVPKHQLPKNFDAREAWPKCKTLFDVRDQSRCGSCWAVSAAATMSARLCIGSGMKDQRYVSAYDILTCCDGCGPKNRCNGGGNKNKAFKEWVTRGYVTGGDYSAFPVTRVESCKQYPFPMCAHYGMPGKLGLPECDPSKNHPKFVADSCSHHCTKGYEKSYWSDMTHADLYYTISGEEKMQRDLVTYGPMAVHLTQKEDFFLYKSGIYKWKHGKSLGGHIAVLMGYGEEKGKKYWLVQNVWNSAWGDKGYVKIRRGHNEMGIENDASGAISQFDKLSLSDIIPTE